MRDSYLSHYDRDMIDYREWFKSATGQRVTAEEIAKILDVSRATATRRLMEGLEASDVIKITRFLRGNPLMALVDLGFISQKEALDFLDEDGKLVATTDDGELALELARRLNPATRADEINEIAALRSARSRPISSIPEWGDLPRVADGSPDEPGEGDDDYHDGP